MMRRGAICLVCLLGGIRSAKIRAQEPAFRAQTNVVQVPVSVTGGNGRDVEGLSARDFKVLDDGAPRRISVDVFGARTAPISLAIAIQSAGISTPALKKIERIGGMIEPLVIGTRGEAAVVTFDSEISWVQDFTGDSGKIRRAFAELKPFQSTQARMIDAILEVTDRLRDRKGRKVLLLISE